MPTKRQVFAHLTRDELNALIDRHDVIVANRRSASHLADRLDERGPALPEILAGFSRDRLKELCRALHLDDSGRDKTPLVERLAGLPGAPPKPPSASPPPVPSEAPSNRKPALAAEQLDLPIGAGKLTPEGLQRYLWSAADILRGSIDSSDYKNYIFGLVFLKRLSDRFNEECEALVAEGI